MARDFLTCTTEELLDELARETRVPGAGPAAALTVASAAALVAMAARFSRGSWPEAGPSGTCDEQCPYGSATVVVVVVAVLESGGRTAGSGARSGSAVRADSWLAVRVYAEESDVASPSAASSHEASFQEASSHEASFQ